MVNIPPEQLQHLTNQYDNARMDGLCHAGAWEIVLREAENFNLSPETIAQLELYLQD